MKKYLIRFAAVHCGLSMCFAKRCVFTGFLVFGFLSNSWAANWYVSKSGNNAGDGKTWSTAWNDFAKINWTLIKPGDVIYLDGGTNGMLYGPLNTGADGSGPDGRIFLKRSIETGHSGIVTTGRIKINNKYITLDGVERDKIIVAPHGGYNVDVYGDYFELKNTYVKGDFAAVSAGVFIWGTSMYARAPNIRLYRTTFNESNGEDMIKYVGGGTLTIEESLFMNNVGPADGQHRDVLQIDGGNNFSLNISRNIFWNTADVFMLQCGNKPIKNINAAYNVFAKTGDALKIGLYSSIGTVTVYNNIFYHNRDLIGVLGKFRNNIFVGPSHFRGPVHTGGNDIKYNIWTAGTEHFVSGEGNIVKDPIFADVTNALGPDGIPFTNDDGFRLDSESPGIDAGEDVGYSIDISGNVINGIPDIGAYEYCAGNCITIPDGTPGDDPPNLEPASDPKFGLFKNIFNPTKEQLTITYTAAGDSITLVVYDRVGNEIKTLERGTPTAEGYQTTWDGRNNPGSIVASGVYMVVIKQGSKVIKTKVVVVK